MRKFTCLLLILTFVVQPASTLADVHPVFNIKVHQSGTGHLSFDHDNHTGGDLSSNALNSSKNSSTQFDCHHCCHCHGVVCGVGMPVTYTLECEHGIAIQKSDYAARIYPSVYEKQFRPPRI